MEDIGILRAIPRITIINPSDAASTKELVKQSAKLDGPCYVRIGRDHSRELYERTDGLRIGKATVWEDAGEDLTIFVTGFPLDATLRAAERLREEGHGVRVVKLHTIRPLDEAAIEEGIRRTGAILVIQEANRTGGLGNAIAEVMVRKGLTARYGEISVPDIFTHSGIPDELREEYGLSKENIHAQATALMKHETVGNRERRIR